MKVKELRVKVTRNERKSIEGRGRRRKVIDRFRIPKWRVGIEG